jgi:nucleoside-diphosphate-sugar epimerase
VVAVTGAGGPLGAAVVRRLLEDPAPPSIVAIDPDPIAPPDARGEATEPPRVTQHRLDVRDPAVAAALSGATAVVHLATDRSAASAAERRRALNIRGTDALLEAAAEAGVRRVVVLTSAMVYGAYPANPVPLDESAPLARGSPAGLVGDWLAMDRAALGRQGRGSGPEVVSVRPASLVGAVSDPLLPGMFEAVRLLAIRDGRCRWQFCHTDDLVEALVAAARGDVGGAVTVGSEGWLDHAEVERIAGMRSVVLPASMAFATAGRLHRVGVLSSPASDLHYLMHPWVVGSQQLRSTGWTPRWTNEAALGEHLGSLGDRVGQGFAILNRKNATRAAAGAGATLAVVGSFALAKARARRR